MGSSKKHRVDRGQESKGKKWVSGGIVVAAPLRSISTKSRDEYEDEDEKRSTTPTGKEARIPDRMHCPPAPRKSPPKPSYRFNGVREFFTPPDCLESVFIRHVERAN